jgi:hypothetical protein
MPGSWWSDLCNCCLLLLLQVASLVVGSFRMGLSKGLVECAKQLGSFLASEGARLGPLVETMPSR